MINKRIPLSLCFLALFGVLFISGCAGTAATMQKISSDRTVAAPEKGKAMVVFMRPSDFGGGITSSVFEIKNETPSFIGSVKANEKIAYQLKPGKYLFMVAAKNADFVAAELKAEKTYYVRVMPKMGRWVGQFSLYPMPIKHIYSEPFNEQLESCEWVEKTPAATDWLKSNMANIQSKYKNYYPKWINKSLLERPELLARDGK